MAGYPIAKIPGEHDTRIFTQLRCEHATSLPHIRQFRFLQMMTNQSCCYESKNVRGGLHLRRYFLHYDGYLPQPVNPVTSLTPAEYSPSIFPENVRYRHISVPTIFNSFDLYRRYHVSFSPCSFSSLPFVADKAPVSRSSSLWSCGGGHSAPPTYFSRHDITFISPSAGGEQRRFSAAGFQ